MIKLRVTGLKEAAAKMGVRKALVPIIISDMLSDMGDAFLTQLRGHVLAQDFKFPGLSFRYRARKRRNKTKWWIHEGTLLDLMESRVQSASSIEIGAFEDVPYMRGYSVKDIATILEMGAPEAHIPARPLFKKTKATFNRSAAFKAAMAAAAAAAVGAKRRRK